MPQEPLPLIISLKHWREQSGFSQSDAVKVLKNTPQRYVTTPIILRTLQRKPRLKILSFSLPEPSPARRRAG